VRTTDIICGASVAAVGGRVVAVPAEVPAVPGDLLSALRLAMVMVIETTAAAANGKQKRILLFYPIITGNLPSAKLASLKRRL
jgi:hypothetical protein